MNETIREKLRNLTIAVISAILLFVFVVPMLMSVYSGLQPRPEPTPLTGPSFVVSY